MSAKSIVIRPPALGQRPWSLAAAVLIVATLTLPLGGAADAKGRRCPENQSTTDFYVDPLVKRGGVFEPTGVSSPAHCSFPTITAALEHIAAQGTGGRVIAMDSTGAGQVIFGTGASRRRPGEVFPLRLPEGVTLTTADDPDVGGAGLDPTRYVIAFGDTAASALQLEGGEMRGFTIKSERSIGAQAMVTCGSGSSALQTVTFDGAIAVGGQTDRGLDLGAGCVLTADQVRVRHFTGSGVVVGPGADLTLTLAKVHDNGGDGVVIYGTSTITRSEFAFNGDDGILVDGSASSVIRNNIVRDNASNGIEIRAASNLTSFDGNQIFANSGTVGWDQPQVLFVGPSDPYGVDYWTGSETVRAYRFGPNDCDDRYGFPNQVHTYNTNTDPVGSSEGSVGLYASGGAIVVAEYNVWRTVVENQNVDQDASSFVDADPICGVILTSADRPGPPVE